MRKKIVVAAIAASVGAWAAKDPVIMTVNGVDVPKSEFEYLYNKNSRQQLNPQPLEEYVEMFKLYKLKVADAKAAGIDTTAAFRKEMAQYRHDLASPYLADSTYLNTLVNQAYDRSKHEAEAYHIMVMKGRTFAEKAAARAKADSLLRELRKGADFEAAARANSQDRTVVKNGGYLGYITVNHFPYYFEEAVFSTPEGAYSEVVESPMAYHVVKGGKKRAARGTVLASHIMKMVPRGASEEQEALAHHTIDSIYSIVSAQPALFEQIAITQSDDKGSARQGGLLPWFGAGEMVPEFDSVAFSLEKGAISQPVRSAYGWHIIQKIDSKAIPGLEEVKKQLLPRITSPQDDRFALIKANQTARLGKRHKFKANAAAESTLEKLASARGIDSAFYAAAAAPEVWEAQLCSVDGNKVTVGSFLSTLDPDQQAAADEAPQYLQRHLDNYYNTILVAAEEARLLKDEPEYRNLLNEYEEGSLLYEVSKDKVWDKAAKDTEGLARYFDTHRTDYRWQKPKVKGYLVQTLNDSVADLVKAYLPTVGGDTIVTSVRKTFSPNAHMEKVLVSEGTNPIIDYLVFGGKPVSSNVAGYKSMFMYDVRLIEEPEEVSDVRGLVTNDYQNALQTAWEEDLLATYPVTVYPKTLKKVKRQ